MGRWADGLRCQEVEQPAGRAAGNGRHASIRGALQPPSVAILIPALDEEANLARLLPAVLPIADQVVVSDGGSRDGTIEVAESFGVPVVHGAPGRGGQLNRAAAASDTDVLLFLHADTLLPDDAVERVRRAIAGGAVGGGFLAHFASPRPIMELGSRLVDLRTRLLRTPLGDQAQFITRDAFLALGGFRDWPILEDLDLMRRLKRIGRIEIVPEPVRTSARRYERGGIVRTVTINWLLWALYFLGVSPRRLGRLYRNIR